MKKLSDLAKPQQVLCIERCWKSVVTLMDSVLTTQVREFEQLKAEQSTIYVGAYKNGEASKQNSVDKWKKRLEDSKVDVDELNKNIARLKKEMHQQQDTIDA